MAPRAPALTSLLAALFAASLAATGARAQESPSAGDGTVVLRISGPDDPALRDSIRELLARLHLAVSAGADAGAGKGTPVANVDIDLSSPGDAVLLVTDASGALRFRRSVPRDATPAIVREEIAHAVQSAVESELLAARERPPPAPAPPPPPPPAVAPPPVVASPPPPESPKEQPAAVAGRTPFGLELTTLAGAGPIASGSGPVTRVGLGAVASARAPLHPSLGFALLYAVPFDSDSAEVTSHTSLLAGRGLASLELYRGRWLGASLGVGGGFDVLTVTPRSPNLPSSNLGQTTTRTDPILSAMATAHVALFPGVVFLLSAGADVDLDSRRYVLAQGTAESDVLAPWRVRPMVLAGFGFTALGEGHFTAGPGR